MIVRCNCLFLIALVGLAMAQPANDKLASITGTVVNSVTGQPLTKVTVSIYNPGDNNKGTSVATNAAGVFQANGLAPGKYTLFASRQGFIGGGRTSGANQGGMSGKIVTLGVGENLSSVKLMLAPQGVIAGRVTDYDGEPMQNVQVQAFAQRWSQGQANLMPAKSAVTNDLGEYRLTELAAGRYYVQAAAPARPRSALNLNIVQESYPPVFSPGVTDLAQAQPVEVTAGNVRPGIDVRLFKVVSHRLHGKIASEDWLPGQGISFMLVPQAAAEGFAPQMNGAAVHPDGTFNFPDVVPGSYFLMGFTQSSHCRMPIEVRDKNIDDLVAHFSPGLSVTARVHWDGEAPPDARKVQVNLQSVGPFAFGATVDRGSGVTVFKNVATPKMTVSVDAPIDAYIKAIRYGGQEVNSDTIEITEGAELDILMRQGTGAFEGTVESDEATVPDAVVVLVPVNQKFKQSLYEEATSDQNGHFKIDHITPGEYDAYAFESVENGAWFDPAFSAKWSRRAERIKIQEKSHETKKLSLIKSTEP